MRAGTAVLTAPRKLHYQGIIHVADIKIFWCASETIIRQCVRNALDMWEARRFKSIALPLIGSGIGGFPPEKARTIMLDEITHSNFTGCITLVDFVAHQSEISNRLQPATLHQKTEIADFISRMKTT